MKIVAESHIHFVKDYFGHYGELVLKPGRAISHADVKDADILLVRSITPANEALLANSSVKFVGSITAGIDHLDTNWLDKAGIAWSAAFGFNAPPVADYVVSCIAALKRKRMLPAENIKAAVIGVGHVGKLVVERLKLLNIEVISCDPIRAEKEKDFNSTSLDEISDVDLILLHVPLTKSGSHPTYHFIDKVFLERQKRGCVLLNASRGAVINSQDLLQYGQHLQWCFDVWEHEPNIDPTLLEGTLIATPHIAGYSLQSKMRGIEMIYKAACAKKIIEPHGIKLQSLKQTLRFAGDNHHWIDIVLGIFNPLILTAMMRTTLLPVKEHGQLFDEMRNQFNYRHELSATYITDTDVATDDRLLLQQLGVKFESTEAVHC